jgi:hypothetical protein
VLAVFTVRAQRSQEKSVKQRKIFEEPKETVSRLYRYKSDGYCDIRSEVAR